MNKHFFYIIALTLFGFLSTQKLQAQNIGQKTFFFTDKKRNRPVTTEVWYPTADTLTAQDKFYSPFVRLQTVRDGKPYSKKRPLIYISHGTGGGRLTLEWLADQLVQAGYIVAAVDHYGNTFSYSTPEGFLKPWERPQDISFSLTNLLKDKTFSMLIDETRLGMAGFSLGGYTTLALAGAKLNFEALKTYSKSIAGKKEIDLPEFPGLVKYLDKEEISKSFQKAPVLTDRRFKAFFAICPAIGQGFITTSQVKNIINPVYIVGTESDSITPFRTNALHYHKLILNSEFYLIKGRSGHYVFLNEADDIVKKESPVFFNDDPSVSRHDVHDKVGQLAIDFFNNTIKNGPL
jgi:predicted dienelactone hydrolase